MSLPPPTPSWAQSPLGVGQDDTIHVPLASLFCWLKAFSSLWFLPFSHSLIYTFMYSIHSTDIWCPLRKYVVANALKKKYQRKTQHWEHFYWLFLWNGGRPLISLLAVAALGQLQKCCLSILAWVGYSACRAYEGRWFIEINRQNVLRTCSLEDHTGHTGNVPAIPHPHPGRVPGPSSGQAPLQANTCTGADGTQPGDGGDREGTRSSPLTTCHTM